jgi:hypothetical protein
MKTFRGILSNRQAWNALLAGSRIENPARRNRAPSRKQIA